MPIMKKIYSLVSLPVLVPTMVSMATHDNRDNLQQAQPVLQLAVEPHSDQVAGNEGYPED